MAATGVLATGGKGRLRVVLGVATTVILLVSFAFTTGSPANASGITVSGAAVTGTSRLHSVACPSINTCIAVGTVGAYPNGVGVVVPVVNGVAGTATSVSGTAELLDVACTTDGNCVAVGDANVNNGPGVVVAISSSGVPAAAQSVANVFRLEAVACQPPSTNCVAVGDGVAANANAGAVVKISAGTAGAMQAVPTAAGGLFSVACVSVSACLAAGSTSNTQPSKGAVVAINSGTPSAATAVDGTGTLEGISCGSSTACEAVGAFLDSSGQFIAGVAVALTNGAPGTVQRVNAVNDFNSVTCLSAAACLATGGVFTSGGARSITAIDNGVPGTPQNAPVYLGESPGPRLVACPTATTCVGVGYSDGTSPVGQVVPVNSEVVGTPVAATGSSYLFDVACPSSAECIAVGTASGSSGFVADITIPSSSATTTTTAPPPATVKVIATGAAAGGGPHVRVFAGSDLHGIDSFFAYDTGFLGGVNVAAGDVNGDGYDDIITGAGPGGGPHVKVFSGKDLTLLRSFFAYDPAFTGGVSVAAGDVNGDGFADIVTGAGPGGGPHVKVFSGQDLTGLGQFMAYSPAFTGGVTVAAADLDADGKADVVTGAGPGGGPHVRLVHANGVAVTGSPAGGFFAYDPLFTGGVFVGAHVDSTGVARIVTGAGPSGGMHVRVFTPSATELLSIIAAAGTDGAVPAIGDFDSDAADELTVSHATNNAVVHRIVDLAGTRGTDFFPYGAAVGTRSAIGKL